MLNSLFSPCDQSSVVGGLIPGVGGRLKVVVGGRFMVELFSEHGEEGAGLRVSRI